MFFGIAPLMEGGLKSKDEGKVWKWNPNPSKNELSLLDQMIEHTKTLKGSKKRNNETLIKNIQYLMTLLALEDEKQLSESDKFLMIANLQIMAKPPMTDAERCELENRASTVTSIEWHKLTNGRNLWEVKKYRPDIYENWKKNDTKFFVED